jgi:TP901 family phage tail tape measure protein
MSRDQVRAAQRQIQVGAALATVGTAMVFAGARAVAFWYSAINAAQEYNRQSALTLTQVDQLGVSLETIKKIGKDVASVIPAPFEEMQTSLYDIFSSMDVNVEQAKRLLMSFSKAAVAGQVDLQDASRATIGILNAYHLSASHVNQINDVMFQLVRKGVGTYGEFATTIGRAVPSAVRAGQSIQSLAGMLAFLTRNGLSAAMASSSAARALDAISNAKTVKHLKDLGDTIETAIGKKDAIKLFGSNFKDMSLNIKDAAGNFLPMNDIMTRLGQTLGKLPPPQRAAILQEIFKGSGGNIQAMRFFNTAIKNFGELNSLTHDMINSSGSLNNAYKIMFQQPASKVQLLSNKFQILKTEIGDYLLPLRDKLVEWATKLIDAWNKLSPHTRKLIVQFAAIASVATIIVGAIAAVAGLFLMMAGAAALAGTSLGAIVGIGAAVIAGLVALGIEIWALWKNHERVFNSLRGAWNSFYGLISGLVNSIVSLFSRIGTAILPVLKDLWNELSGALKPALASLSSAWNDLKHSFEGMGPIWQTIQPVLKALAIAIGVTLGSIVVAAIAILITLAHIVIGVVAPAIRLIAEVCAAVAKIFRGFIQLIVGLITGDWSRAWKGLVNIVQGAWNLVFAIFRGAWGIIKGFVMGVINGVIAAFRFMYDVVVGHSIVPDLVNAVVAWFRSLPGKILGVLAGIPGQLYNLGANMISSMTRGIVDHAKGLAGAAWNAAKSAWNAAKSAVGAHSPSKLFHKLGGWMGQGMINGLADKMSAIQRVGSRMAATVANSAVVTVASDNKAPVVPWSGRRPGGGTPLSAPMQNFYITTQEIDPRKHAADLGWELAVRVA